VNARRIRAFTVTQKKLLPLPVAKVRAISLENHPVLERFKGLSHVTVEVQPA